MKRLLIGFSVILSCTAYCHAWNPPDFTQTFTSDTRSVTISTTAASPTLLLSKDAYIQRNYIVNNSSFSIYIATSASVSFSTSFFIPGKGGATTDPVIWSPDGVNSPFQGPLYGAANGPTPPSVGVFRSK